MKEMNSKNPFKEGDIVITPHGTKGEVTWVWSENHVEVTEKKGRFFYQVRHLKKVKK